MCVCLYLKLRLNPQTGECESNNLQGILILMEIGIWLIYNQTIKKKTSLNAFKWLKSQFGHAVLGRARQGESPGTPETTAK